jgi:hypothetical protein
MVSNDPAQQPGRLEAIILWKGVMPARSAVAACSRRCREALPPAVKELGLAGRPRAAILPMAFGADARMVSGAVSLCAPPVCSTGLGSVFGPPVGDRHPPRQARPRRIPLGRLTPLPTLPPNALRPGWTAAPRLASAATEADLPLPVAALGARRSPDPLTHLLPPTTLPPPTARSFSPTC